MIQELLRKVFGVSRYYHCFGAEYGWGRVEFYLQIKARALVCPQCRTSGEVIRKGSRCRCLQTVPIGLQAVYLVTEVARCRCRRCDVIFEVHPPLPGRRCAIRASSKSGWRD